MTIHCGSCNGTGYEGLESATGGMVDTECTCALGHAVVSSLIGPLPGTSHELSELSIDKRRAAMKEAGAWECWICDHTWHEDGEACPIASKPSGWIAPEYRKGDTA